VAPSATETTATSIPSPTNLPDLTQAASYPAAPQDQASAASTLVLIIAVVLIVLVLLFLLLRSRSKKI
jgi:hypothetical protein